jgi:hypothetical protein
VHCDVAVECFGQVTVQACDRSGAAAFRHQRKAPSDLAADQISNNMEVTTCLLARHSQRIRIMAVNNHLDTEPSEKRMSTSAGRRCNLDPTSSGKLDEQVADPTGGAMHEHQLASLRIEAVEQLDGGSAGERQNRRLKWIETLWSQPNVVDGRNDLFCVRAKRRAPYRQQSPDPVALAIIRSWGFDFHHFAGEFVTDDKRVAETSPGGFETIAGIDGIHAGRLNTHSYLTRSERLSRKLAHDHLLCGADDDCCVILVRHLAGATLVSGDAFLFTTTETPLSGVAPD